MARSNPTPAPSLVNARALKRQLRTALLRWFDHQKRDLPWRATTDPYTIWVSEVMLQQTQVDRVIPYFERFVARFPTVKKLASAPLDDVLAAWSGLGYYTRARNLHAAAKAMVAAHRGTLPDSVEALLALPGFGRYTAGAVASIAFGLPAPLVDGNVARVFARLFAIDGAAGDRARDELMWSLAQALVTGERPGDFNQSLMELGATICVPAAAPLCLLCPVAKHCAALAQGRVAELPQPKKPAPRKRLEYAVVVARRKTAVLLARRKNVGLFGGLWEMPCVERGSDGVAAIRGLIGPRFTIGPELEVVERTLTHRDLVLHLHPVTMPATLPPVPTSYTEWRWVERTEIGALGMSSAMEAALSQA